MDRNWMFANRLSIKYGNGVEEFIKFARTSADNHNRIKCPCIRCSCIEKVKEKVLRDHLIVYGIDRSYTIWI
jgi:hypothetical protein